VNLFASLAELHQKCPTSAEMGRLIEDI
jgi:hypothetical protein